MACCHLALPNKVSILALRKPFVCVAHLLFCEAETRTTSQKDRAATSVHSSCTLYDFTTHSTDRHEKAFMNHARTKTPLGIVVRPPFTRAFRSKSTRGPLCCVHVAGLSYINCSLCVQCVHVACSENMSIASGIVLYTKRLLRSSYEAWHYDVHWRGVRGPFYHPSVGVIALTVLLHDVSLVRTTPLPLLARTGTPSSSFDLLYVRVSCHHSHLRFTVTTR